MRSYDQSRSEDEESANSGFAFLIYGLALVLGFAAGVVASYGEEDGVQLAVGAAIASIAVCLTRRYLQARCCPRSVSDCWARVGASPAERTLLQDAEQEAASQHPTYSSDV